MESLANAIRTLGARKSALEAELAKVNQELQEITAAVSAATEGRSGSTDTSPPPRIIAEKSKAPAPQTPKPADKKPAQRSWFEPGEAFQLFQKLLSSPKSQSDAINEIVVLKGHQNLPKAELERFKWAAQSALKAAVAAKKLVRREGKVALASARRGAKSKSKRARA